MSPWPVKAAAAQRCPSRIRSSCPSPRRSPARKPPAKASPAPIFSTTVQAQRWHVDPLLTPEPGHGVRVVLDDQMLGLGEQRAQLRRVVGTEHRQCLVGAQENDVAVPACRASTSVASADREAHSAGR